MYSPSTSSRPSIGLALSGGGARAAAHIGVIKALEEQGLKADMVAGTSGGAIAGVLYAGGVSIDRMTALAEKGSILRLLRPGLPVMGLTSLDYLSELLDEFLGVKTFEALELPFFALAANLLSGQAEVFSQGDLHPAIMASCAIPLIFKPIEINKQLYVDGGLFQNLPTQPLRDHCDLVIGVNVMPRTPMTTEDMDGMIAIGKRSFEMVTFSNTRQSIAQCDILIEPVEVQKYGVFNFSNANELIELGYQTATEQMDIILKRIHAAHK